MTHSGRSRLITRTLCMLLALALMPLGGALASEAMSASVTLNKEHMIERQQIAATLSIVGGTAPYTVSYDWIVYDFASTPDSRPSLHKADTIVTSDRNMSFGATIDAAGYGQLDVRITDANDKQIVISPYRDFVAYAAGDFPAEHAQQMLQGRWAYYGEDAAIDFTFILGPGGRARMNSNHYAQLGGYELVTGKAAVGGSGITLTTDLGDTLRFSYRLVATRQDPSLYMDLTVPGGESVFLEYDPNYAYSPFPNMTGVKPTPVPISEEHRRLMGSWSGVSNYDSSQTYLPQLGEDGSLRFEYKSAVKPERNFSFEGKVTAVSSTVISYERDGYYSDYFQYELSADGQTLTLWYQDHEGSLRRGGTPAPVPGDASGDGRLDDKDLEAFVNMLVRGPLPALPHGADADQNSQINLDDLLWLIDRMV